MDNKALARSLMEAGNVDGDFQPLMDHFAEDVVFTVTIPDGTPIAREVRGKQAVVEQLITNGGLLEFRQEKPLEFFGDGDRIVVLGRESVEIKEHGITVPGSEYATVLDFRDGMVTRFLVIQDMSPVTEAYRDGR